jgi:hypothetical protein
MAKKRGNCPFYILNIGLNHPLVEHGIGHLEESGNICPFNIVDVTILQATIFDT